jgi:hypothetical protein
LRQLQRCKEEGMAGPVMNAPIILDVGKTNRRKLRQMEQGCGPLMGDVQDALTEVTASLGDQADGKQLIPVILVYSKRRRRGKRRNKSFGGFFPPFF